jgi:hypothetical protein
MSGPVGVGEFTTGFVNTLVGMCAEVVTLGLQKIRRKTLGAVAVKVGEGAG